MRLYGYSRVSTAEQVNEGASLDTQRRQIEGYCMMQGWTVTEFFVEGGVSGSMPLAERPEGQRLIAAVGKGDIIVAAKLDRAFRSAADALTTVEEFKKDGVGLHLLDLGGDVTGNGIGKCFMTVAAAFAELERDRLRERIREVKRHLTEQGIFSGGRRPFGYEIVGEGKKNRRLVPNPTEQAHIKRMKAMRKAGKTYREIGAAFDIPYKTVARILERLDRA
jgi:putative DNA-invertase from lambdoid prophage Rac